MFHKQSNSTFGKVSYTNKQTQKDKDIHALWKIKQINIQKPIVFYDIAKPCSQCK